MDANELNRAVAEKVMGWTYNKNADDYICGDGMTHWYWGEANSVKWNPCGNWAHFGMVLGRVGERYSNFGVNWLDRTVWVTVDGYVHPQDIGNMDVNEPLLSAACAAILETWDSGH